MASQPPQLCMCVHIFDYVCVEGFSSLQRRLSLDGSDLSGDILAALAELKMSVTLQQRSLVDKIRTNVETLTLKFAESKAELAQSELRPCAACSWGQGLSHCVNSEACVRKSQGCFGGLGAAQLCVEPTNQCGA